MIKEYVIKGLELLGYVEPYDNGDNFYFIDEIDGSVEKLIDGALYNDAELSGGKAIYQQDVREYAKETRELFVGGADALEVAGYALNISILDMLDSGTPFENIDPALQLKVSIEVENDARFNAKEDLFAVWRAKRGGLAISTSWINVIEYSTIEALSSATDVSQLEPILNAALTQAEAKKAELLGAMS